jgi:hypothetical protein
MEPGKVIHWLQRFAWGIWVVVVCAVFLVVLAAVTAFAYLNGWFHFAAKAIGVLAVAALVSALIKLAKERTSA